MRRRFLKQGQSNRPVDNDMVQQRLPTWPKNIPQLHIYIAWIILGIVFLGVGSKVLQDAHHIYESKITYDNGSGGDCYIDSKTAGKQCSVTFTIGDDITGPIYLYYELENFYQNHRRYYLSKSIGQLQGEVLSENDVSLTCTPLYKNGSLLLNPCGLIANSFFTDVFTIDTNLSTVKNLELDETGISLHSDRVSLYSQVNGFKSAVVNNTVNSTCEYYDLPADCKDYYDSTSGVDYKFYYPNDDSTQYLYEQYPSHISPIDGVTNEHFIVWMKTPSMPTFRKLYGKIHSDFKSGDQLVINITANYVTEEFDGKKVLLISTLGGYGGKNTFSGQAYLTIGSFTLICGVFLSIKEKFNLRIRWS